MMIDSSRKPPLQSSLLALANLGVAASEAIVFEDSEHGVSAAKSAGIFRVAVPNKVTKCLPFENANLIATTIADYSLQQYAEHAASAQ